jgi:exodeoxyribonuclease-3
VLAGDFNVVPTDRDIYNPWLLALGRGDAAGESACVRPATGAGLDGCHSTRVPRRRIYTYWVNAQAFSRDNGFRMDLLLLSAEATSRLLAAGVDAAYRGRERPSDHAPTWVTCPRPRTSV